MERRVEEDVAVGLVCDDGGERSIAGADDGDGARNECRTVPVAEIATLAKAGELGFYDREERGSFGFEIHEQD